MSTNTRWIIGLLVAIIVGLAVGIAIIAGDNASDDSETVTLQTDTEETETVETETQPTTTQTTPDDGGVTPPTNTKPDASGGLGVEQP